MTYLDGRGACATRSRAARARGFSVADIESRRLDADGHDAPTVTVRLDLHGAGSVATLVGELQELDGVLAVSADDGDDEAVIPT